MERNSFDTGKWSPDGLMTVNGLRVQFNMPDALISTYIDVDQKEEVANSLPPYRPRKAFLVDELIGAPEDWKRSEPNKSSYVVPVQAEHGIWLDFNMNANHAHEVAVLISIQGVNALDAQPTDLPRMVQYRDGAVCPKHNVPLVADNRCNECGYSWPPQNYICTTGAPAELMWLDGFMAKDGTTRQWVITESLVRSVAKALRGEQRVFALGVAFFLSKEPKPQTPSKDAPRLLGASLADQPVGAIIGDEPEDMLFAGAAGDDGIIYEACCDDLECESADSMLQEFTDTAIDFTETDVMEADGASLATAGASQHQPEPKPRKKFEIAEGARIKQPIHPDPRPLDFWNEESAGMIVITYCPEKEMAEVLVQGMRKGEGPFGDIGVPLGHPGPQEAAN